MSIIFNYQPEFVNTIIYNPFHFLKAINTITKFFRYSIVSKIPLFLLVLKQRSLYHHNSKEGMWDREF